MKSKCANRQSDRSRSALKQAFAQLMDEKHFGEISVGEIADRANIGRSTFYRHFNGKQDVLIALHEDIFERLFADFSAETGWLAKEPPQQLKDYLDDFYNTGGPNVSLATAQGLNMDYVMRSIIELLSRYVTQALQQNFTETKTSIPLSTLASSIAGTYSMVLMSWKKDKMDVAPTQMAEYLHRLIRALITEASRETS